MTEVTQALTELRRQERLELLTTLRAVGPDAPTLCTGWSAADIAAHLVMAEQGAGLPMVVAYQLRRVLPARVTLRAMASLQQVGEQQQRRGKAKGWDRLLRRLEAGPPRPFRLPSVAPVRLVEEWIHHEDVRRANGLDRRPPSAALDDALWHAGLVLTGYPEFLPGREGIEIVLPDGRSHRLGEPSTTVRGTPGEILLFLAGRTAARVDIEGEVRPHLAV